jgi:hypothetical protein
VANQEISATRSAAQFLKVHRSINSAEAAAENNYSFRAFCALRERSSSFSVTKLPMRSYDCADGSSLLCPVIWPAYAGRGLTYPFSISSALR